jgi:hypothetical protein
MSSDFTDSHSSELISKKKARRMGQRNSGIFMLWKIANSAGPLNFKVLIAIMALNF